MKPVIRTLFMLAAISLAAIPVLSQQSNTVEKKAERAESKTPKTERAQDGLRKIEVQQHEWDIDVDIDEAQLEATIKSAVEDAMRSLEEAREQLEMLEIRIAPIEIDLGSLNFEMERVVVHIPNIDIDVEPIVVDLDDFDFDFDFDFDEDDVNVEMDEDVDHWREVDHDIDKVKEKDKADKDKSIDDPRKDKSKGLKKLN